MSALLLYLKVNAVRLATWAGMRLSNWAFRKWLTEPELRKRLVEYGASDCCNG